MGYPVARSRHLCGTETSRCGEDHVGQVPPGDGDWPFELPCLKKPEFRSRLASTEASAWVPGETWPTSLDVTDVAVQG
jgi:hypothetical protein